MKSGAVAFQPQRPNHASGLSFARSLRSWNCNIWSGPTVPRTCLVDTFCPLLTLAELKFEYTDIYAPWRSMTTTVPA